MAFRKLTTVHGVTTIRTIMIDSDGTNLVDGIEIKIEDVLIGEIPIHYDDLDDISVEEVENLIDTLVE